MKKLNTKQKRDIMRAWEDGEIIEVRSVGGGMKWREVCEEPQWDWRTGEYRVKPNQSGTMKVCKQNKGIQKMENEKINQINEWKQEYRCTLIEEPKHFATQSELNEMKIIWRKNKKTGEISNIKEKFYDPYYYKSHSNYWIFNPETNCWE